MHEIAESQENAPVGFGILFEIIKNSKKTLKEISASPPHSLGVVVLLLVSLELVLNGRLINDLGSGPSAINQFIRTVFLILAAEGILIFAAHKMGRIFYRKGDPKSVWTLFNLSLWPLFIVLPIGLVVWTSGIPPFLNFLLFVFLAGKILTDWKIIIDRHYQFNRWQSALVVLVLGGMVYAVLPIILLFSFLGTISDLISLVR